MVLDMQIQFHRGQSLRQIAAWLVKKWGKACTKRAEMLEFREDLRITYGTAVSDEELRAEYKKQIEAQTKPLPRKQQPYTPLLMLLTFVT